MAGTSGFRNSGFPSPAYNKKGGKLFSDFSHLGEKIGRLSPPPTCGRQNGMKIAVHVSVFYRCLLCTPTNLANFRSILPVRRVSQDIVFVPGNYPGAHATCSPLPPPSATRLVLSHFYSHSFLGESSNAAAWQDFPDRNPFMGHRIYFCNLFTQRNETLILTYGH